MDLDLIGWKSYSRQVSLPPGDFLVGRVAVENKDNYLILTEGGERTGILRGKALSGLDEAGFPKVGDWVRLGQLPGEDKVVIEEVLPRLTKISRKAPDDKRRPEQVIVANVDVALIVQSLPDDFSLRRLERYLAIARQGGVRAVVILNKIDLHDTYYEQVAEARSVAGDAPVVAVSAKTGHGLDDLRGLLAPESTFVLLGSSGVGKSSLINALIDEERQATQEIRDYDSRGRHTTTRREMILLAGGGVLIDTPGMRELSLWADEQEMQEAFPDIDDLALQCRYTTCDHDKSDGCAIKAALDDGTLDPDRYRSYLKLRKEAEYLASKTDKGKRQERKAKEKGLSRLIRGIKADKRLRGKH